MGHKARPIGPGPANSGLCFKKCVCVSLVSPGDVLKMEPES